MHRALAEALSGHGDPDREAWHRASAAEGPDPEVVAALELAGARAQRRGGHVAALAAYERAAALCDDPAKRTELTFAAARSAWACGRAGQAQALLSKAREATNDPLLLADVARLQGHIEVNLGSASKAHRLFVEAAQAVYPIDPARALDIGVAAAVMRTFGADSGTPLPVDRCPRRARRRRSAADAVPASPAGRDDAGGRGRLVRRHGCPGPCAGARRPGRRPGRAVEPRQRGPPAGRRRGAAALLRLRARASAGGRCGDGRRSTACRGSASASTWPATSSRCAPAPRRPSHWARASASRR